VPGTKYHLGFVEFMQFNKVRKQSNFWAALGTLHVKGN